MASGWSWKTVFTIAVGVVVASVALGLIGKVVR